MANHTATDPQIASRIQRAIEQRSAYTLLPLPNSFLVAGPTGSIYTATTCRCDCPDYTRRRGAACKHIFMVREELAAQQREAAERQVAEVERLAKRAELDRRMALDFPI